MLARIHAFVASYTPNDPVYKLSIVERQLIEDGIVNFLLEEEWSDDVQATVLAVQHALAELTNGVPPHARAIAEGVDRGILDLAGRLERRESANLAMYEHLIMLSETNRQLRAQLAEAERR